MIDPASSPPPLSGVVGAFSVALADALEGLGWDGASATFSVDVRRRDGTQLGTVTVDVRAFSAMLLIASSPPQSVAVSKEAFVTALREAGRAPVEQSFVPPPQPSPSPVIGEVVLDDA